MVSSAQRRVLHATLLIFLGSAVAGCNSLTLPLGEPSFAAGSTEPFQNDVNPEAKAALDAAPKAPEGHPEASESFKLRGRIEADAIMSDQTPRNRAIVGDFPNAVGFRRLRLGADGKVGEQVHWRAELDFASGSVALRDVYIGVSKLPFLGEIKVGYFLEPFSLEGLESSNYFSCIEMSPSNALDPAQHWGVAVYTPAIGERATFAAGAFKSGTDSTGADIGDGNDMAYTFRATALPWYEDGESPYRLMHLGGAFSQRFAKNDTVTFNQGPRTSLLQPASDNPLTPFIANLTISASQLQLYNLEWATVWGPISFQAEWNAASIDQIGGGRVFLHGGYVFASVFLTGEHRQYDAAYGGFTATRVRNPFFCMPGRPHERGLGAWELVARFAYLDFDDPNLPLAANGLKVGGRLAAGTFGLNWYLNDQTRIMFNYARNVQVDPNFGPSGADVFFIRCAVFW